MKTKKVLIITGREEISAPLVISCLEGLNQPYFRIDVDDFVTTHHNISLAISNRFTGRIWRDDGNGIDLADVKSVWYRRPKKIRVENVDCPDERQFVEDEFSASLWSLYTNLETGGILWMNKPLYARNLLEQNKMLQAKFAREVGLTIPRTLVTNSPDDLIGFCESCGGTIAIKSVSSNMFPQSDGTALGIYTQRVQTDFLKSNIDEISRAPLMAQEYVVKRLELRITVAGKQVLACAIHSQDSDSTRDDWRRYDFDRVKHEIWNVPEEVETKILRKNPGQRIIVIGSNPSPIQGGGFLLY